MFLLARSMRYVAVVLFLSSACADTGSSETALDAGTDTANDTTSGAMDAATYATDIADTTEGALDDVAADSPPDVIADAAPDVVVDTAPDVVADTAPDVVPDVDSETGDSDAADGSVAEAPFHPFPQHVALPEGAIRPSRDQASLDADVRAFYDHWRDAYLVEAGEAEGHTLYRVSFGSTDPGRTVSEGQGYGMVITAMMAGYDPNAQTFFDGLWRFSRENPSGVDPRLMDWDWPSTTSGNDSAFDGDADIAFGLLLADAQWGSDGEIDYAAAASEVIAGILESTIGPASRLPMLGDWVDPDGSPRSQWTPRSSDFMPGHFRAYREATGDGAWDDVIGRIDGTIDYLQTTHTSTGLLPDFMVAEDMTGAHYAPADPGFLEGPHDGHYYYNAGRVPWRLTNDYLAHGGATRLTQIQRINTWIRATTGGDPMAIRAGYTMEGAPIGDYFTTFFAGPFGVAAMVDADNQAWLDAVYDAVRTRHENYFEDTVNLLCLITMSGNFWAP